MPYIITTYPKNYSDPADRAGWDPARLVTRRAVATLQEAGERVYIEMAERGHGIDGLVPPTIEGWAYANTFAQEGDTFRHGPLTIGPLPDGTVIEVTPAGWHDLIQATLDQGGTPPLVVDTDQDRGEILAAFNQETAR